MTDLLTRMQSALTGRYAVEREIGRGGMATVFLAEELHPRRKVAIKVLTPDVATHLLRRRFLREVNLASTLSHPHIVPVFATGEVDGLLYFVMPYIDGESLRQRLLRRRVLPLREALAITRDVAAALQYAHDMGVIHRDIKPENILLVEDHAQVADFGIARALGAAGGENLTQAGLAVGTPAYMSPEQAEGRGDLDGRSDVYSLGSVLLEMLGGTPPRHPTPQTRLQSVRQALRTLTASSVTRSGVEAVLRKALAVDSADRFVSARDFRNALDDPEQVGSAAGPRNRALGIGVLVATVAVAIAAIASLVLPSEGGAATRDRVVVAMFENQTGDPALTHVGPMATDWITQGLAQTGLLDVVVARSSLAEDPGASGALESRLRTLAAETDADLIVSGAYYRQGRAMQFQTRINDPNEDRVLLALRPVSAPVDSPLVAVEILRQRVMGALATLVDERLVEFATGFSEPPSYDAYRHYVDGMTLFMHLDQPAAISRFLRAAELDSTFASATLFAAIAYGTMERWAAADSLARIVNRLRDDLAPFDRHELDWVLAMARGDLENALSAIRAAGEIAGAETLLLQGVTELWTNRIEDALRTLRRVDPLRGFAREFFLYWDLVCGALHALGRHQEELREAQRGRVLFPELRSTLDNEMRARIALGDAAPLDSLWDLYASLPPQNPLQDNVGDIARLGALEARRHGNADIAQETLQRSLDWYDSLPADRREQEVHRYGLARSLYVDGQYEASRRLFQTLARERPDSIAYQGYLGAIAARLGQRETALRISRSIAGLDPPFVYGVVKLWQARIAAALGDREGAVRLLRQAQAEGRRFDGEEKLTVDFQELSDYQPFRDWLAPRQTR